MKQQSAPCWAIRERYDSSLDGSLGDRGKRVSRALRFAATLSELRPGTLMMLITVWGHPHLEVYVMHKTGTNAQSVAPLCQDWAGWTTTCPAVLTHRLSRLRTT